MTDWFNFAAIPVDTSDEPFKPPVILSSSSESDSDSEMEDPYSSTDPFVHGTSATDTPTDCTEPDTRLAPELEKIQELIS